VDDEREEHQESVETKHASKASTPPRSKFFTPPRVEQLEPLGKVGRMYFLYLVVETLGDGAL